MNAHHHELYSHAIGASGSVAAYGHYGRPVLAFPSEGGRAYDWQDNGMIARRRTCSTAGRIKLYCVDSFDAMSWSNQSVPLEERARQHGRYESWILDDVVPFIHHDTGGEIITTGISPRGVPRRELRAQARGPVPARDLHVGQLRPVDVERRGASAATPTYFNNPLDYVGQFDGDHLDWLRSRLSLLLVCGQGQWEDTTGSLESTKRLAGLLAEKGIRHELDLWGYDVPHDWPSWRAQIAHHLPRFC